MQQIFFLYYFLLKGEHPPLKTSDDWRKYHCHHITPLSFQKVSFCSIMIRSLPAFVLCPLTPDRSCRVRGKGVSDMEEGRAQPGWRLLLLYICVRLPTEGGLCAQGHLQKYACAGPWHHSAPSSRQECRSERRGFVEERKETGGEEKEEKGKKEKGRETFSTPTSMNRRVSSGHKSVEKPMKYVKKNMLGC